MPAGGMRWNSHLPKKGAGRPKGSVDGVRRPGIKGGQRGRRFEAEKQEDPLYIPGHNRHAMSDQPAWIDDVADLARGQRIIRDSLRDARLGERMAGVMESLLSRAESGDHKATELLLAYVGGKPVAFQATGDLDQMDPDRLAAMADEVEGRLRVVPKSGEGA